MARNQLFQEISGRIRTQIVQTYANGEAVPSQRALALMYGVGQTTVSRIMELLKSEGIVRSVPKVGWLRQAEAALRPCKRALKSVRVGLVTSLSGRKWEATPLRQDILALARELDVILVDAPNPHLSRRTPSRSRIDPSRVAWNTFDVALLIAFGDTFTFQSLALRRQRVISVDFDATAFGIDSVVFDNFGAGRMAAEHLLELGHQRFAVTYEVVKESWSGEQNWMARRHGFEAAVALRGGVIQPAWCLPVTRIHRPPYQAARLEETIREWRRMPPAGRPTAIFAADQGAVPMICGILAAHGFSVPGDISIVTVGWDPDQPPKGGQPFTFVWLDRRHMVKRALSAALAKLKSQAQEPALLRSPVLLIPGDSSRAPARA